MPSLKRWKPSIWVFLVVLVWLAGWYLPWQPILSPYIWLRLGIGLSLFIIPGICVYGLLAGQSTFTFSHITFGFVISHLIFALLGTAGRLLHLSFETIQFLMALAGIILMLLYLPPAIQSGINFRLKILQKSDLLTATLITLVSLAACLIIIQRVLTDDDLTYLAYLTNWQNSPHLDFNDIIFGVPEPVHPRFWLMSAPFAQALLVRLSNVPGVLLLNGYYEPFLLFISVLGWYELARVLKFPPRAAGASVILQLGFLLLLSEYLHPGSPFFAQLSTDKTIAAFIIAPVFFQSLVNSLEQPTKGNLVLSLLTGASLTLMHPVILAYSAFIGGAFVLFNWKKTQLLPKVILIAILFAILLPQAALRFVNTPSQEEIPYALQDLPTQSGLENMIQRWGKTQFYGFNPTILDMKLPFAEKIPIPKPIAARGWLIFPFLAAAFALKEAKTKIAARFILACFLLAVLAWFPLSGWVIGYFLSAWMLERALWLFPFGLSAMYALLSIRASLKASLHPNRTANASPLASTWSLLTIAFLTLGLFLLHMRENNLPDLQKFSAKTQRYRGLAEAGQELNRLIDGQAYVAGSEQLNDLIPAVSSKSKLIIFRISQPSSMSYFSESQRLERIADMQRLFSKKSSPQEKMNLIEKYDIHFLLLQNADLSLFEDLGATYPGRIKKIERGGLIILQISGGS
ncbi:MAG: hypothetical protein ACOYYF_00245 [Chloroflexota bacterium]|nr:hypothetical protein [Chloroflexota bacterium]MBI5702113.1 hypothetical protein [Chloroflexota bacterium]